MADLTSNLRNCPFCGARPETHSYIAGNKTFAWVRCSPCNIQRTFNTEGTEERLRALVSGGIARWWNGYADETKAHDPKFEGLLTSFGAAMSRWTTGSGTREEAAAARDAVRDHYYRGSVQETKPYPCPVADCVCEGGDQTYPEKPSANRECEKSKDGKHDLNASGMCVFCWDRPAQKASEDRRPTGQCSWGCYYNAEEKLVRDPACTVHGAS